MTNRILFCAFFFLGIACTKKSSPDKIAFSDEIVLGMDLTEKELYNKVLGMIVGSAIGDAMGAPTEMWSRAQINEEYGFVKDLDSMFREASPEGIWIPDLPAGGTTDDTRWKILTTDYLLTQSQESLEAKDFAKHILDQYNSFSEELQFIDSTDIASQEAIQLKMLWLQEWAKVSAPFISNNLPAYADSLGKFYGGEMVCAGLLYASAIGSFFPGNPEKAYQEAYKLSIYDLGYAKDLTAIAAAMTAAGMTRGANVDSIKKALKIDPQNYFESRLVGRSADVWIKEAMRITEEAENLDSLPRGLNANDSALLFAFSQLDSKQQDMPFHAGEIFLQTLTAMMYTDFDFIGTLIFLTNYGRDNDTTAALAGGILGAWYGFENIPLKERNQVLEVGKNILGQDLELKAKEFTFHLIQNKKALNSKE